MKDSNGREIRTGDIVEISGAYFKTSNGRFFVSSGPDMPGEGGGSLWLRRVKKNGEICVNSATSSESWPPHSYCSDRRKNAEARAHNEQNARITVIDGVNTWHVAERFREKANEYKERGRDMAARWGADRDDVREVLARGDFYAAVAERLEADAKEPKNTEPEKGIRFYTNGIKVDGGRLIRCWYSLDDNSVTIYAKDCARLPREYFAVRNDTDIYTDYFDDDKTTLTPDHPLYRFARYVAAKGRAKRDQARLNAIEAEVASGQPERWRGHNDALRTEAQGLRRNMAEWERMKDPGQPTAADLKAVEELKTAKESARIAAEHAEDMARREEMLRKRTEGRHYIESVAEQHPVVDGQPTVEIPFSENPAFYSWTESIDQTRTEIKYNADGTQEEKTEVITPRRRLILSVAAAEIVLRHFDEEVHAERRGYDKTDFIIRYKDPESGEDSTYEGRYDLGDNDGGLIEHIRAFVNSTMHDEQEKASTLAVADLLEQYTDGGRVVSVDIAPGVIDLLAYRKKQEQEQRRAEVERVACEVAMLTDDQLEAAVMCVDPEDKSKTDVARYFLQELSKRDADRAIEVYKKWSGRGA